MIGAPQGGTVLGSTSTIGLIGESFPEAIVPLARCHDGQLSERSGGASVTVTIGPDD